MSAGGRIDVLICWPKTGYCNDVSEGMKQIFVLFMQQFLKLCFFTNRKNLMAAIISRNVPLNSSIPLVNLKTADYGLFLENPKSNAAPDLGLGISFRAIGDKITQVATPVKLATVNALIQACAPPSQNPALIAVCGNGTTTSSCTPFSLGSIPGANSGSRSQTVHNGFAYIDIAVDPMFANSSLVQCLSNNAGNSLQGALNNAEAAKRGSSVTSGTSTLASKKGVLLSAVLASACYVLAAA